MDGRVALASLDCNKNRMQALFICIILNLLFYNDNNLSHSSPLMRSLVPSGGGREDIFNLIVSRFEIFHVLTILKFI